MRNAIVTITIICIALVASAVNAQPRRDLNPAELDTFILETMENYRIPGVATCIVRGGRIGQIGNYGWANIEDEIPVTENTMFLMVSVSKTVTVAAIMQLWEDDEFELDDPINGYIDDFDVIHPDFPEDPITFRMLMTHTSSIADNWGGLRQFFTYGEDSPWALGEFLEEYLVEGGEHYNASNYRRNVRPGTSYHYSSPGIALLGYLVECISGDDFADYCQENIFDPLGMENTSWFLEGLDEDNLAVPYDRNGQPYQHCHWPLYPSVTLRTSTHDLAQFLIAMTQYGENGEVRILDSTTVERMFTVEVENAWDPFDSGLIWFRLLHENEIYWSHWGNMSGAGNWISLHPATTTGALIFTNRMHYEIRQALWDIFYELYDHSFEWMNFGVFEGQVTDAEPEEPIEGAYISTTYGRVTESDEEGIYFLPFGDSTITVSKIGYNSIIIDSIECAVDETLAVNFELTHPEMVVSIDEFNEALTPGHIAVRSFTISDSGNGVLEWSVERRLLGESGVDPGTLRETFNIGEVIDDSRLVGVVYIDDNYYVTGGGNDTNRVYVMDGEGELVRSFPQFGDSRYGMKDLAWDGELIWGVAEETVYGFNTDGDSVTSFQTDFDRLSAIAWDSDRELLWISETLSDILGYDREGNHNQEHELSRQDLRIYGLAYMPIDSSLYIFNSPGDNRQVVHKMNPDNGDTTFVMELTPEEGGSPVGCFVTNEYDPYGSWVFMDIANAGREDRIDIWQLKPNIDWFVIEPAEGSIDPGGNQELTMTLNTVGLDSTLDWEGELIFSQAVGGEDINVPISMNISSSNDVVGRKFHLPTKFGISAIYPNPFNATTTISYALPIASNISLELYNLLGQRVQTLFEGQKQTGHHSKNLIANDLPSGLYFVRLSTERQSSTQKVMLIR